MVYIADNYELTILSYLQRTEFLDDKVKRRKEKMIMYNMQNMLRRTAQMFEWKNLPSNLKQRNMELLIQTKGVAGIIKQGDKYYCVLGGLGGIPNYDYMPTIFIVSNPYLKITSKNYEIYGALDTQSSQLDNLAVIIPNDSLYKGLNDIFSFHSEMLTEIQLTKKCVYINERMPNAFVAPDNNTYVSILDYLKDLADGKQSAIMDKNLLKEISLLSGNNGSGRNIVTQLLEAEQYQKAALFNDLGLQMNYNMKRETITSSEAQLGESALLPLCDDMLKMRRNACEQMNKLWGLNVEVDFSSAWKDLRKSIEVEMAINEKELKEPNETTEISAEDSSVQSTGQEEDNNGTEEAS